MSTMKVTIELNKQSKFELEALALEMGITIEEWCSLAIEHHISMQKSIEELSGQMGFALQNLDLELMTNQLFSFFEEDDQLVLDDGEPADNMIIPSFKASTVKDKE
ncbi:hypothetical protein BEP19_04160 [Ammoniphilus oxalaticus]|uniref:Uncharacterized protein n=1 Tax=Ammoniphilus oxalaticus TaxID=66863 RepID=A0A419SLU0_9BACL|nr:hypothetical protein [Ammoniphilus oxalaticus]RKD25028.1 hypothetical protein BEP19_04160 [Ammoniphilus oxalaticus]